MHGSCGYLWVFLVKLNFYQVNGLLVTLTVSIVWSQAFCKFNAPGSFTKFWIWKTSFLLFLRLKIITLTCALLCNESCLADIVSHFHFVRNVINIPIFQNILHLCLFSIVHCLQDFGWDCRLAIFSSIRVFLKGSTSPLVFGERFCRVSWKFVSSSLSIFFSTATLLLF